MSPYDDISERILGYYCDLLYVPSKTPDEEAEKIQSKKYFEWKRVEAASNIAELEPYPDDAPLPEYWRPLVVHALLRAAEEARTTQYTGYGWHLSKDDEKKLREAKSPDEWPRIKIKHVNIPEGFVPAELPFRVMSDDEFLQTIHSEMGENVARDEEFIQYSGTALFWLQQRTSETLKEMLETMLVPIEEDVEFIWFRGRKRGRKAGTSRLGATALKRKTLLQDVVNTIIRASHVRTEATVINELGRRGIEMSKSGVRRQMSKDGITYEDLGLYPSTSPTKKVGKK